MGTDGDDNERGEKRPGAEFGPPVSDLGPPLDDAAGFGAPLAAPPPTPPGALPEMGWRPAGAPGPSPATPPPGPFGAPVAGTPPVAPPPGPPTMPPRGPVQPPRSAPTSVFGDAVATPPPVPPRAPGASPFGAPDPRVSAPSEDQTVRFSGERRDSSPFGDSVPVTSGREATEVIRRDKPGPRAQAPAAEPAPETVRMATPDIVRQPERAPSADDAEDKAWWNSPDEGGAVPKPPEAGLSWADDPIARRLAPKNPVTPAAEQNKTKESDRRLRWIIGGAAAAVLLVVALVLTIGLVKRGGGDDPGVTAAPIPSVASPTECKAMSEQAVTVGNGPGDTSTGAKAILGFQYAFYVDRSGAKVREYVAPDAENISPAETIQKAIDDLIPAGSTHCVRMRETSVGRYDVELREWHPDGSAIVYKQEIVTTNTDGKWQVKSITAR
ncbi:hypothetical protein [Nocardia neocaledoniensis]|uniref:hypothetical protein n=1 Tax=Nocardia neocaledoniensis TaxID=236511 RepID=UPI002456C1C9|nr:hypothetical protein [Nocardia neocaledoniensis]